MQLNLNVHFWVGFIVTIASAIAGGTVHLTNAIPADWIPVVTAWSSIVAMAGGAYLTIVSQTGIATPAASPPKAAMLLPILIAAGLAIAWAGPAAAQGRQQPAARAAPLTGDPVRDLGNAVRGGQTLSSQQQTTAEDLLNKLDKLALPDFEFALAQANATNNVVTIPCWQAWIDLLSARQKAQIGADGNPLPLPDPHIITGIERISELLGILRPDSKITLACVQIAATAGKDVGTFVTGIISGGALGLFKLPISIP